MDSAAGSPPAGQETCPAQRGETDCKHGGLLAGLTPQQRAQAAVEDPLL